MAIPRPLSFAVGAIVLVLILTFQGGVLLLYLKKGGHDNSLGTNQQLLQQPSPIAVDGADKRQDMPCNEVAHPDSSVPVSIPGQRENIEPSPSLFSEVDDPPYFQSSSDERYAMIKAEIEAFSYIPVNQQTSGTL